LIDALYLHLTPSLSGNEVDGHFLANSNLWRRLLVCYQDLTKKDLEGEARGAIKGRIEAFLDLEMTTDEIVKLVNAPREKTLQIIEESKQ